MKLRDYQEHGVNNIRAQFAQGKRRVCFVAPCGSGKTVLLAYMAAKAAKRGKRTLFLVHRRELLSQAGDTFTRYGIPFGVVGSKRSHDSKKPIQIGSIQTVAGRIAGIFPPDLIVLDECHHAAAKSWLSVINFFPEAFVVGLTATPQRLGGKGLGEVFDTIVEGPTVRELIQRRFLAPYKYYAPPAAVDLSGIKTIRGDFDQKETACRMDRPAIIGDAVEHYKKLAAGTKAICYCAGVNHSRHTAYMFKRAHIAAEHIDAKTPLQERENIMQDFRRGKISVLCNCDLFGEGVDVPSMETVILLRPTKSLTLYIQQSMRGMRIDRNNPGKTAIILDHVGNVLRFGLPDEERQWSLEDRKKKGRNHAPSEIKITVCPKCFSVYKPAPRCPYCGAENIMKEHAEIEQKAGELQEFTAEQRKQRRMEVGAAHDIKTLEEIARLRGYSPGWVYVQARLKGLR